MDDAEGERENPSRNFKRDFSAKTVEDLAKDLESINLRDEEVELNVMSIKLTTDIYLARRLALCNEGAEGGLFLAMDLDEKDFRDLKRQYQSQESFYLPRRLGLDYLKEIHISPRAARKEPQIREAFAKYNPVYFIIT